LQDSASSTQQEGQGQLYQGNEIHKEADVVPSPAEVPNTSTTTFPLQYAATFGLSKRTQPHLAASEVLCNA
jgi:hypothetical protein